MVTWLLVHVGFAMVYFQGQPPATYVKVCKYQHPTNQFSIERHWVWPEMKCPPSLRK